LTIREIRFGDLVTRKPLPTQTKAHRQGARAPRRGLGIGHEVLAMQSG